MLARQTRLAAALIAAVAAPGLLAACQTAETGGSDGVSSNGSDLPYTYSVLMQGEPQSSVNKGRYMMYWRDGTNAPVPASNITVTRVDSGPNEGNLYLFKGRKRGEKICIGKDCGIFSKFPGRRNAYQAVFPPNFQSGG